MHLKPYFSNSIRQLGYELDPQQVVAVDSLEHLSQSLADLKPATVPARRDLWPRLSNRGRSRAVTVPIKGRYLWGGVGRGKTWIMDLFYHSLPLDAKLRQHYQHFMQMIHRELTALKGNSDPLKIIARRLAAQYRIICLDEFHVNDITDAMLLHGLLVSLFEQGLVLVVTSNLHPDELYRNGLQRERFMPAIALIKQHTELLEFSGTQDYRQRQLQQAVAYFTPVDDNTLQLFHVLFHGVAGPQVQAQTSLRINQRDIAVRAMAAEVAWFDFLELCATARSARDYIEIANRFHTVFIDGVPVMSDHQDDQARRFVHLVDEFYDRKIRLLLCAEVPAEELYRGRRLAFEFERTVSRLQEMRSREYQERSCAARASALPETVEQGLHGLEMHGLEKEDDTRTAEDKAAFGTSGQ